MVLERSDFMRKISKIEPKVVTLPGRKKVAAYARVSRDTQRLAHSLSAQVSYYSNLIQKNPEWEYAGVYADLGISGTSSERRGEFLRLLEDCEAGCVDIVLTKSISRFARNTIDLLSTVRRLKELGIEVRFEKENINSLSEDGELMLSLLASFAQEESRSISENCKWGIRKRFESGEIGMANKHILGYQWDEEQRKYTIIPEEAVIVKLMFQRFLEGVSYMDIAKELNDVGYRTVKNCRFQDASVRMMIMSEVYVGDIIRQKSHIPDPITKVKVKNEGALPKFYMPDCHEGIIDRETYKKVQEELGRRASLAPPSYCFTSKIKCGVCDRNYTRKKSVLKGREYIHWHCRAKKEPDITCTSVTFNDKQLRQASAQILGIGEFDEELFEQRVKQMVVQPNGDIEYQLIHGETKLWVKPPKKIKPPPVPKEKKCPPECFDKMIFCGVCGLRFGHSISCTKNRRMYWHCRAKNRQGMTCDSVNYDDSELKEIFCKVMGRNSFEESFFKESTEKLIVQKSGTIEFHLKDGTIKMYETLKLRVNKHISTFTKEFDGKVFCGCCGSYYHQYSCRDKYFYWQCYDRNAWKNGCTSRNISDSDLRKVTAYLMGMEEFDTEEFVRQVRKLTVGENGNVTCHFYDGRTKHWQRR